LDREIEIRWEQFAYEFGSYKDWARDYESETPFNRWPYEYGPGNGTSCLYNAVDGRVELKKRLAKFAIAALKSALAA
jgi:hypothetical protein